jgi:hypothetical protein
MRKALAWVMVAIILLGLSGCLGHGEAEASRRLHGAMAAAKGSGETVLLGKLPVTRPGLAALSRQIAAADRDIDAAQQIAGSLSDSPMLEAAALDYLKALSNAVDHSRERYATAIALDEAKAQDRTVPEAIGRAQDEASLEQARVDADNKAGAVATAVDRAGDAVIEHERRLDALMTALLHDGRSLAGYALVSNEALAAAMASNVTAGH